jgi:3-oxoacyl-[acyl-carrier-protein] synthase II
MVGHLLGAAGAVEAIACILAIKNNIVPPTINFATPDPECDLNYTFNKPQEREVEIAMSNAFGFGGHNTTVVFKRFTE